MTPAEVPVELDFPPDPAYPTSTAPDAVFPGQTREPLGDALGGVVLPATWSRLQRPFERSLRELWDGLGLLERSRPTQPVALHYGRIALNAHGWEHLRCHLSGAAADPSLVGPPARGLARLAEQLDGLRVRLSVSKLRRRLERAESASEALVRRANEPEPEDLETAVLARGPLHEREWTEILLPWLSLRLGDGPAAAEARLRAGMVLEACYTRELGCRLSARRVLDQPGACAYLTIEERLRAVHEGSSFWNGVAHERMARVDRFVDLEVPLRFWGRPRVEAEKTG